MRLRRRRHVRGRGKVREAARKVAADQTADGSWPVDAGNAAIDRATAQKTSADVQRRGDGHARGAGGGKAMNMESPDNEAVVSCRARPAAASKNSRARTSTTNAPRRPVRSSAQRRLEDQIRYTQCRMACGGEAATSALIEAATGRGGSTSSGTTGVA